MQTYNLYQPEFPSDLIAPPSDGPAILLYDIETSPALAWVWGAYDQNIIKLEQDWYILSFAYKWLGSRKVGFVSAQGRAGDDYEVATALQVLFDRADIVVAHNGFRFDQKRANARFLYHDLAPPSPYQAVDTLAEVKRYFAHLKNTLGDLGRIHELGAKQAHHGFELWLGCMNDDPKSWRLMERYNRQDVLLLERLYLKLLPWMGTPGKTAVPNMGHWAPNQTVCPKCGHNRLIKRGIHRTSVSEFQTFQCKRCGGYSRARKRVSQRLTGGVGAQ